MSCLFEDKKYCGKWFRDYVILNQKLFSIQNYTEIPNIKIPKTYFWSRPRRDSTSRNVSSSISHLRICLLLQTYATRWQAWTSLREQHVVFLNFGIQGKVSIYQGPRTLICMAYLGPVTSFGEPKAHSHTQHNNMLAPSYAQRSKEPRYAWH